MPVPFPVQRLFLCILARFLSVCVCMFAPFFLFAVIAGGFWGGVERYVFILSYILTGHLPDRLREHAQRSPFFPVHTQECTRKNTVESVACIEKI